MRERERDRRSLGGAQLQGARRPAATGSSMALALEGRRAPSPSTSTSARPASFLCAGHERRGHSSSRLALTSSAAAGQQQLAAADSLSQNRAAQLQHDRPERRAALTDHSGNCY